MAARVKKTNRPKRVDSVRASRDGHQFHEAWVARRALGLLLPRFDLCGIAVEGLSEEDEEGAPPASVEIADATFYYGKGTFFESCARIEIAQFKYSISNCRGLCDPILPGTSDSADVVRRSIHRFKQAIEVVRRTKPHASLFVIIDAADNAAMEAASRHQWSFPRELLESLTAEGPVEGLTVIVTARPERVAIAIGNADCRPFEIEPFTLPEADAFISARRSDATPSQIEVVHHRAEGNPRVIANLIEPDRDLVSETQTDAKVELNDLIQERIARAVQLAEIKGANPDSIAAFLCALSLLPPPVPVGEAAVAFGVPASEIESFAADLAPLLDRTRTIQPGGRRAGRPLHARVLAAARG